MTQIDLFQGTKKKSYLRKNLKRIIRYFQLPSLTGRSKFCLDILILLNIFLPILHETLYNTVADFDLQFFRSCENLGSNR